MTYITYLQCLNSLHKVITTTGYRLLLSLVLCVQVAVAQPVSMAVQKTKPASHHVTSIKPSRHISLPQSWPLTQGKLTCTSCHGDKNIEQKTPKEVDKKADNFLRQGPYPNLPLFCQNCHQKDDYQAQNIHQMINRQGEINQDNCLYCHNNMPELNDDVRQQIPKNKRANLRIAKEDICYGCHLKTPHFNALEHQVKASDNVLKQLKLTEKSKQISLPLSDNNEVLCISCHNPHQRGVIATHLAKGKQVKNNDLVRGNHYQAHRWNTIVQRDKRDRLKALDPALEHAFQYQQITHEVLLRLPAKNGELCLACHTFSR